MEFSIQGKLMIIIIFLNIFLCVLLAYFADRVERKSK